MSSILGRVVATERRPNTPHEFWGARLNEWPDAPRVSDEAMRALVTRLAAHLAQH